MIHIHRADALCWAMSPLRGLGGGGIYKSHRYALLLKFQSTATKRTGRTGNPDARLSLSASTLPLLKVRKYAAVLQTAVPDQ